MPFSPGAAVAARRQQQEHEAFVAQCKIDTKSFDPQRADIEGKQHYASCIKAIYPLPQHNRNDDAIIGGIFIFVILGVIAMVTLT